MWERPKWVGGRTKVGSPPPTQHALVHTSFSYPVSTFPHNRVQVCASILGSHFSVEDGWLSHHFLGYEPLDAPGILLLVGKLLCQLLWWLRNANGGGLYIHILYKTRHGGDQGLEAFLYLACMRFAEKESRVRSVSSKICCSIIHKIQIFLDFCDVLHRILSNRDNCPHCAQSIPECLGDILIPLIVGCICVYLFKDEILKIYVLRFWVRFFKIVTQHRIS